MFKNTPAMGWNTWNTFTNEINEKLIIESCDALIKLGLDKLGYEYIVIDDCWSEKQRDKDGNLVYNKEKFPHGMKYISDYIHSKGLKFGMYSCAGAVTCEQHPASYNHEFNDAKTFASWGVDYLKYDYCFRSNIVSGEQLYKRMGLALANSGRDILFSACTGGLDYSRVWLKEVNAHSFRSTNDIKDNWTFIKTIANQELTKMEYNGQGCFNDLDMLVVGMNGKGNCSLGGCTLNEYYTYFAFWCFFGSPLMIGCDLRNIDEQSLKILKNKNLIRINQDKKYNMPFFLGRKMEKNKKLSAENDNFYDSYPTEIVMLAKYLDDGKIAVGCFNFGEGTTNVWNASFLTEDLGITPNCNLKIKMTDCETGEVLYSNNDMVVISGVSPHSSRVFIAEVVSE